jgi:hypothetical protein
VGFSIGDVATFTLGAADYSEYISNVEFEGKRDSKKLPRLGSNPIAKLPGPRDDSLTVEGYNHPTLTDAVMALYVASVPAASAMVLTLQSGQSISGKVFVTNVKVGSPADDAQTFEFDLEPDEDGLTYA